MDKPVGIGLVGCGFISGIYLENLRRFSNVSVVACADADPARAEARGQEFEVPVARSVEALLDDPSVDIVLNLTTPDAHGSVARAAIGAAKSVYNEKPLALSLDEGRQLVAAATAAGVRLGAAPDTFLGAGLQTCRRLIDTDAIGRPVAASAFMLNRGHERWHPNPEFFYRPGGGPLFDMGPYYLTALVTLLGPVRRVTGSARASFPERTITSQPRAGETIPVEVPTHLAAVLDFDQGAIATLVTSFDVWASETPRLEIYGASGSLSLPDPNTFGGPVRLRAAAADWADVPVPATYAANSRALGVADMAAALRSGRAHRANGDLALHTLEIMHAVETASHDGRHVAITTRPERPAPLPTNLGDWELDP